MNLPIASLSFIVVAGLGAGLGLAQLGGPTAGAPLPAPLSSLASAADRADLVFEGVVQDIQYRPSQVSSAGDRALPLTYVTFSLDKIYRGQVDTRGRDGLLTLRFLGGPLDPGDLAGPWLKSSEGVEFQLGGRELLQVANHDTWGVPLVRGPLRRLSIRDERIFTEDGRELAAAAGAPRVQLDDDGSYAPEPEATMGAAELRYWLSETLAAQTTQQTTKVVRSAFAHEPFSIAGPQPTAPQLAPVPARLPLDPSERLELGLFGLNTQNPVVR